jgi:diguanylate cyclase (GGDEF)-like protein
VVQDALRETDFFARIGGEEFALIVSDISNESIHVAAERIRVAAERSVLSMGGQSLRVTVSAGTAVSEPGEADVDALYHDADMALYRAKANGRNRVERSELIAHIPSIAATVDR